MLLRTRVNTHQKRLGEYLSSAACSLMPTANMAASDRV